MVSPSVAVARQIDCVLAHEGPAPGSPRPHDPSDSPTRLIHRYASACGPAVRRRRSAQGTTGRVSPAQWVVLGGPAPLRDVSITWYAPLVSSDTASP